MRSRGLFVPCMLAVLLALCNGDQEVTATAETSSSSTATVEDYQIQQAVDLLTSIGATGWCHPTSDEYGPALPICESAGTAGEEEESVNKDEFFYWKNGILASACVVTAALAAGLTMGLLSIDPLLLHIKIRAGSSEEERQQARKLLPIVEQHHLLLVTLLLLNSMAMEALPIFLDALVPSYIAVLMSVTLVLFFGEIIPSALFTGPNQLKLASRLSPLVKIVMALFYPIAKPIASLLDIVLHDDDEGDNGTFNRGELSALVRIQHEERMANKQRRKRARAEAVLSSDHSDKLKSDNSTRLLAEASIRKLVPKNAALVEGVSRISDVSATTTSEEPDLTTSIRVDEVVMVEGALKMSTSTALDVFTPLNRVFAVPYDMMLNERNIVKIYSSGHSRIPVFERQPNKPKDISHFRGVLLSKQLIVVNSSDKRSIDSLPIYTPSCVSPHENLVDCINMFQQPSAGSRGGHMALVCTRPKIAEAALEAGNPVPKSAGLLGIITMEDALEELLQEEIYDEMDAQEVRQHRIAKKAFAQWKLFVARKRRRSQLQVVEDAMERAEIGAGGPGSDAVAVEINNESSPLLPKT
mmetsp:Transcript_792/g.1246  ORF Transcript_792/g.1246 Transcript_792/m.1246 type:complete len:584 (-) Transcript_792:125-1876(-)